MQDMVLSNVLPFSGKAFLYVATVNKSWRRAYRAHAPSPPETSADQAVASVSRVRESLPLPHKIHNAAFFHAARLGNTNVLDFMLTNNMSPSALYTTAHGAMTGQSLQSLAWTVANGFPLDRFVCHGAAAAGNLEMLASAVIKGCPWDPDRCADIARRNGHGSVYEWIRITQ